MAESKKDDGVIFLKEWKVLVFSLAPEHQLVFWDLFTDYEYGKVQICENKFVFPVWNFITSQLDDMKKKYNDKIVLRNQQNGQKGGRPKKLNVTQHNPVGYLKTQRIQENPVGFDNAEFVKPEIEILNHLNQVTGRNFKPVESNLKLIRARLEEESPEILKAVIELKTFEWLNDTKMSEYLRPETLFNATKFQGYSARAIELKNNPTKLKLHVEQRSTEARKSAAKHYDPLDSMPD